MLPANTNLQPQPQLRPPGGAATDVQTLQINKAKKIAWVESQIKKDQNEAVNPNYKTPFRNKEDACKRLLRYHVFDEPSMSYQEWQQSEQDFQVSFLCLLYPVICPNK